MKQYHVNLGLGLYDDEYFPGEEITTYGAIHLSDAEFDALNGLLTKYEKNAPAHFNELPEKIAASVREKLQTIIDRQSAYDFYKKLGLHELDDVYEEMHPESQWSFQHLGHEDTLDFVQEYIRANSITIDSKYDLAHTHINWIQELEPRITKKYQIAYYYDVYYDDYGEATVELTDEELAKLNELMDKYGDDATEYLEELGEELESKLGDAFSEGLYRSWLEEELSTDDTEAREFYEKSHPDECEDDDDFYEPTGWDALTLDEQLKIYDRFHHWCYDGADASCCIIRKIELVEGEEQK